jgi:hypothetical protein
MEVAMARTLRRTLSALVAVGLVSLAATSAIAGGKRPGPIIFDPSGLTTQPIGSNSNTPTGLATLPPRPRATTHYEIRWWQDYTNGGR